MAHVPVLLKESVELLLGSAALEKGSGLLVDGTFGGGGHSRALLEQSPAGVAVIGVDQDPDAIARGTALTADFPERFQLLAGNFRDLEVLLQAVGIREIDGLLLDLGVSSFQLDEKPRGFSFQGDGPLDMRMDPTQELTAAEIVNHFEVAELTRIFKNFGEENYAAAIARRIVERRRIEPLKSTRQLAELVEEMVPAYKKGRIHPATRIFQALRLVVNDELGALEQGLRAAAALLRPGGRLVVIAYHSLEDRLVKNFIRSRISGCQCPPGLPECACGFKPSFKSLTVRGRRPGAGEVAGNRRSRSASLRAAERLAL